jgi:hypothetical protein
MSTATVAKPVTATPVEASPDPHEVLRKARGGRQWAKQALEKAVTDQERGDQAINDLRVELTRIGDPEEQIAVIKLGPGRRIRYPGDRSHAGLSYPRDDLTDAMGEDRQVEQPQVTRHATQNKFDARVAYIARRDGVSMTEAIRRAAP